MTEQSMPVCRNCGGTQFFSQEVSAGGGWSPNLMPIGFLSGGRYRLRVCGGCALTDWFVPNEFLHKVKQSFEADK